MQKKYNQILFHSGNCLNNKKPYSKECKLCIELCPHNAINIRKEIYIDKCTECGVCMAVCPSDGFVDRDMHNLKEYIFNSEEIVVNCPLAIQQGYEISCLGMIDEDTWSTLKIFAETKQVTILTGDCEYCADKKAREISEKVLKDISEIWKGRFQIIIKAYPDKGDSNNILNENVMKLRKNVSEISLRQRGRKKFKALFPALEAEEVYNIPIAKQWLTEALNLDAGERIPYRTLIAGERCTGCNICEKICPQKALQTTKKNDNNLLIYEPLKCVRCNRCVETCIANALWFDYRLFSHKLISGKILLFEATPKYCKTCGKQLFRNNESSLCIACASKI